MSHKKTIKLVKLSPKPLAKSVFKTKTLKVADESDATMITTAVRKAAAEKAERALLEEELAKPSAARNSALMRKYGTENTAGAVDAYPDFAKGGKFHIVATVPDDPNIPLAHRPTPWSVTIVITHEGNQFDFVFPFSRAIGVPSAAFKLDNFQVFLDSNHNVIVELSPDYTIYEALLDYKTGAPTYLTDGKDMFEELGISKGTKLDFRIRGLGWFVKSTRLKVTSSALKTTTVKKTVEPKVVDPKTVGPKMVKVIVHEDVEYYNNVEQAHKLADIVRVGGEYPLLGLSPSDKLSTKIYVDRIYASSRLGATPTIVLDDVVDGEVFAIAFAGPTSVETLLKKKKLSTKEVEAWVIAKNREVFATFMSKSQ